MSNDQWCANCAQMVNPKPKPAHWVTFALGLAIIGVYWFISLHQPWYNAAQAAVFTGIVGAAFALKYSLATRCPICKSQNLEVRPHLPTPAV